MKKSVLLFLTVMFINIQAQTESIPLLKDVFKDKFYIGNAPSDYIIKGNDQKALEILAEQHNSITAENVMKWESVHPQPGKYNFEAADRFIEFGLKNDMYIIGHTLVWHSQTPRWVFQDANGNPETREGLIAKMEEHITTVMSRYKGKVKAWDVVNEAFNEDGTLRSSPWQKIIGDDFIKIAFQIANKVDPDAKLIYNDYNLCFKAKREGCIKYIKSLLDEGVKVYAIGEQGHWDMVSPKNEEIIGFFEDVKKIGLKAMITELDINVLPNPWNFTGADVSVNFAARPDANPYTDGLPDSVETKHAEKYAEVFSIFLEYQDILDRVTFWGVHDGHSWKNNFPVRGRTDYPLLFDRQYQPKKAFYSIIDLVK